jgi:hypothetical protein
MTQYKDFAKFCQEAKSGMLVPAPASVSSVPHIVGCFKGRTDEFMVYALAIPELSQRFRILGHLKPKVVRNCTEHCILSQIDCALNRKKEKY